MPVSEVFDPETALAGLLSRITGQRTVNPAAADLEAAGWETWATTLFPIAVKAGFAQHHRNLWEWAWTIEPGTRTRPFVAIWPRGGAKSSTAEMVCVALGALVKRRYVLYVSATQELADKHVSDIGTWIEQSVVERYYPDFGTRAVGKFGAAKAWRRNRLHTASGFIIDAAGLDTAVRGLKVEGQRPDLIVLDDVDHVDDSLDAVEKKIRTITQSVLPAGSTDVAVLAVQNLIQGNGVFARLAGVSEHRADFLQNRILDGPYPAIENLTTGTDELGLTVITGGTPIWEGQGIAECQHAIDQSGITAFLRESQHEVDVPPGGMFDHLTFQHCNPDDVPQTLRCVAAIDPAVTDTDSSDAHGVQVDALGMDNRLYRLFSWERRASPERVMAIALIKACAYGATELIVETNQGGDTWRVVFESVISRYKAEGLELDDAVYRYDPRRPIPRYKSVRASKSTGGKAERAAQMLVDYEHARIIHVLGTHHALEKALRRFPKTKPHDLTDTAYYSWRELLGQHRVTGNRTAVSEPRPVTTYQPR